MRRDKVEREARERAVSILCPNQNIGNRPSRTHKRVEASAQRLRSRRLLQELEAADTENSCQEVGREICWKKKRAALELQRRDDVGRETRDKLLGALALMQLSGVPVSAEAVLREAQVLLPVSEAERILCLSQ